MKKNILLFFFACFSILSIIGIYRFISIHFFRKGSIAQETLITINNHETIPKKDVQPVNPKQQKQTVVKQETEIPPAQTPSLTVQKKEKLYPRTPEKTPIITQKNEDKEASLKPPLHKKRTITIKNNISEDMTSYKYWNINYKPSSFKIVIDNQDLSPTQEQRIALDTNKITVRYEYEFLKGYRKGKQDIEIVIPEQPDHFDLEFSWLKEPRLKLIPS